MHNLERLQIAIGQLNGLIVQSITAGGSAGSIFGAYLARAVDEQWLWYLSVECSWRLTYFNKPLASSLDDNSADGPLVRGLQALKGRRVISIEVRPPAFDLNVQFENELELFVFADVLHSGICWYLLNEKRESYSVEPAGHIVVE